ncbi:hypothetical protein LTR37_014547 [Vermiconidia calcicola]|uniref:Uncharacterized protein n=1 Tax=Vermiconidia calcicola TaxID=1690605 RepID=A0ACC3MUV1_9PEZI|nr:hypothetical protein LTR37_014547 [Vermiconidia calcicola]
MAHTAGRPDVLRTINQAEAVLTKIQQSFERHVTTVQQGLSRRPVMPHLEFSTSIPDALEYLDEVHRLASNRQRALRGYSCLLSGNERQGVNHTLPELTEHIARHLPPRAYSTELDAWRLKKAMAKVESCYVELEEELLSPAECNIYLELLRLIDANNQLLLLETNAGFRTCRYWYELFRTRIAAAEESGIEYEVAAKERETLAELDKAINIFMGDKLRNGRTLNWEAGLGLYQLALLRKLYWMEKLGVRVARQTIITEYFPLSGQQRGP